MFLLHIIVYNNHISQKNFWHVIWRVTKIYSTSEKLQLQTVTLARNLVLARNQRKRKLYPKSHLNQLFGTLLSLQKDKDCNQFLMIYKQGWILEFQLILLLRENYSKSYFKIVKNIIIIFEWLHTFANLSSSYSLIK